MGVSQYVWYGDMLVRKGGTRLNNDGITSSNKGMIDQAIDLFRTAGGNSFLMFFGSVYGVVSQNGHDWQIRVEQVRA